MLAGITGVGGTAVGTGAFNGTQSTVSRDSTISVVNDNQAYLRLEGRSEFIEEQTGVISINIGELEFGNGSGVGADSRYYLAGGDGHGLFSMKNESPVDLFIHAVQAESKVPELTLFDTETRERLSKSSPQKIVSGGSPIGVGVLIDTTDIEKEQRDPFKSYERTLKIIAKEVE